MTVSNSSPTYGSVSSPANSSENGGNNPSLGQTVLMIAAPTVAFLLQHLAQRLTAWIDRKTGGTGGQQQKPNGEA